MFRTTKLPNGLHIVTEQNPFVRSIAFGIWVKNGSRNESPAANGISHFIEHMFFKGTKQRTASQIAEEMDAIGGQLNAYTAKEYTCYHALALDTHFDTALDVLADMFFNSKFDDADIKKERNVILEEINMYEDSPEELAYDNLQANVWKNDPLGRAILGEASTISTFDSGFFKTYFNAHYHPENTVIALAGNFDTDQIVQKIERYFGDFTRTAPLEPPPQKAIYTPCVVSKDKDIEQAHLTMAFPGLELGAEKAYDLAVLNTIFGSGMSSRLFQTIREDHGLVYSIYSYNSSFLDTGLYSIYAGLNPAQLETVVSLILKEIKRLFDDKITADQVAKTKEQLKSNYFLSLESSSARMNSLGKSQLMLNKILFPEDVIAKIDAVSLDGLYELAHNIFKIDQLSVSIVGPVKSMNIAEMINRAK